MKLLSLTLASTTLSLYTIMGMLVGLEFDPDWNWMSINLLLVKITITRDPWNYVV